jgi:hypothetical protein
MVKAPAYGAAPAGCCGSLRRLSGSLLQSSKDAEHRTAHRG